MGTNEKRRRANFRQLQLLALIIVLLAGALYAYLRYSASLGTLKLYFENPSGERSAIFRMEVADTAAKRNKGLMFRKPHQLPVDHGMIFVYPGEEVQRFWMKETYIPLDIVFIDRNFKVVGVLEMVPILNEKPRAIDLPSQYVVELWAGSAKKHGIVPGSQARLSAALSAK